MNDLLANASPRQIECRRQIADLEASLRQEISEGRMEQTAHDATSVEGDSEVQHHYGDGVYVRSQWLPAGSVTVGRMHLQARVCIVSAGRCRWIDEFNPEPVEVQAPWVGEFKAGSKTVVVAIEDTYWSAILGTDLKDSLEIAGNLTTLGADEYRKLLEVAK